MSGLKASFNLLRLDKALIYDINDITVMMGLHITLSPFLFWASIPFALALSILGYDVHSSYSTYI